MRFSGMSFWSAGRMRHLAGAIAIVLIAPGCFGEGDRLAPPVRTPASIVLPNPSGAVFANCRALVCTPADVPSCDFQQTSQDASLSAD